MDNPASLKLKKLKVSTGNVDDLFILLEFLDLKQDVRLSGQLPFLTNICSHETGIRYTVHRNLIRSSFYLEYLLLNQIIFF